MVAVAPLRFAEPLPPQADLGARLASGSLIKFILGSGQRRPPHPRSIALSQDSHMPWACQTSNKSAKMDVSLSKFSYFRALLQVDKI